MAEYSKLIITNDGKELVAKSFSGRAKIDFTRVATSSETYKIESWEGLTELIDIKQSSLISKKEITSQSAIKVQTAFTNTDLTVGYYMRALGLYAKDPDKGEVLYAVTIEKTGNCYMPPYNGVTVSGTHITLITAISNAENVELKVDPAAVATIEQLQLIEIKVDDVLKGISNVDNTSDMEKPVSNATRQAIDESYANANGFTQNKIAELINGAPENLNTLNELADAIATNKTIMDAVNEAIGRKASQAELDTHTENNTIHITTTERTKWNEKQDKMTVDSALSVTSTNPIQNKTVKGAIDQQSAQNVNFTNSITGLNDSLNTCFQSVSSGKAKVAAAITGKGVSTAATATFDVMSSNINKIVTDIPTQVSIVPFNFGGYGQVNPTTNITVGSGWKCVVAGCTFMQGGHDSGGSDSQHTTAYDFSWTYSGSVINLKLTAGANSYVGGNCRGNIVCVK